MRLDDELKRLLDDRGVGQQVADDGLDADGLFRGWY
jgi:hypothetical protein